MGFLDFEFNLFMKVFIVVLALVAIGFTIVIQVYGTISATDITGTLICAPLAAYLVHLWLLPND